MDILTASSLPQSVNNTPAVQPYVQTGAAQAPEAAAPGRQAETLSSVEVQISDAAREAAARDRVQGAPQSPAPPAQMANAEPPTRGDVNVAANAPRADRGATTTQEALRMFADNAGVGMEQATVNASPLRTSA